ncbi:MAG: hypothetical protein E7599_00240 [Ruminococcaceae bacterium]|nr:hypothetical protein [Oscillospiraceae bacterium]
MKKLCAFLLAALSALSLASCGSGYSKDEVAKYIDVTDYKTALVTKAEYDKEYKTQYDSVKDSYCTPVEVEKETQIKDGLVVNATYETLLTVKKEEGVTIKVGENTLVNGDRKDDASTSTAAKTFDSSLIGKGVSEKDKPLEITYTYSSVYAKDPDDKYLQNKQVTVTVTVIDINGKTDKDTKIKEGDSVKLDYVITLKLTDYSGTKKDITVGETKLGDLISIDDTLKTITVPGTPKKTDSSSSSSSSSTTTTTVDYKKEFKKEDVKLEGDKLDKFLAGKNVTVSGTVHSVKEKPAFTDALVKEKSSGTYNTIAELEDAVMDSVVVNLALENLVDKSKVKKNLPKSDVTKEYDALEASAKNMYAMVNQAACLTSEELASFVYQYGPYYLGVSPAGSTVQAMCNAFAAAAASTVKEKMVLYYVADAEGMKVTDKEYKAYLKEQASIQGVSSGEYEDAYGEDSIRETMLFTEVSDYLCELIKGQLSLTNKSDKK